MFAFVSCVTIGGGTTEADRLAQVRPAIVRMAYDGGVCTAFHVGNHRFITANHCLHSENPKAEIELEDQAGNTYRAIVITTFPDNDVAIMQAGGFYGPKLELWNDGNDGALKVGTKIMTIGYPGYNFTNFTFEVGYIKDLNFEVSNRRFITSRDNVFRGQSGGPTISVTNGKVIGMNDALIEMIDHLSPFAHQHGSISMYVPYDQLADALKTVR